MGSGIEINIETNTAPYLAFMKEFPVQASRTMAKVLGRIGKSAEAAIVKEITSIYNISRPRLRAAFFIITPRANLLLWHMIIKRRKNQPNITSFGAKQTKKAVSVSIIKGKRQKFKGAFITTFKKTGGRAAFQRDEIKTTPTRGKFKGKISTRGENKGQPIERAGLFTIYGPQIIKMAGNKNVLKVFEQQVIKRSEIEYPREFQFLANKLAAKHARLNNARKVA